MVPIARIVTLAPCDDKRRPACVNDDADRALIKHAAAAQNQVLNLRSTQISKIMAIALEQQIRQLAHVATGDKLVCPRSSLSQINPNLPYASCPSPASGGRVNDSLG